VAALRRGAACLRLHDVGLHHVRVRAEVEQPRDCGAQRAAGRGAAARQRRDPAVLRAERDERAHAHAAALREHAHELPALREADGVESALQLGVALKLLRAHPRQLLVDATEEAVVRVVGGRADEQALDIHARQVALQARLHSLHALRRRVVAHAVKEHNRQRCRVSGVRQRCERAQQRAPQLHRVLPRVPPRGAGTCHLRAAGAATPWQHQPRR
jgi:hypothetical protein